MVNNEGWIVTAAHIIQQFDGLGQGEISARAYEAHVYQLENDPKLSRHERRKQISMLKKPKGDETKRWSAWFGLPGNVKLVDAGYIDGFDLACARLEPFDKAWISTYPVFKDPSKNFDQGASLCRLGFPFHQIEPIYDPVTDGFSLPAGAVPLPLFPIEGIFTRTEDTVFFDDVTGDPIKSPRPLRMIETSSPGLRGQSGGPIFDVEGQIWGIQSATKSYPLGLAPKEPQYLHVGIGIHPETIISVFDEHKIAYQLSNN